MNNAPPVPGVPGARVRTPLATSSSRGAPARRRVERGPPPLPRDERDLIEPHDDRQPGEGEQVGRELLTRGPSEPLGEVIVDVVDALGETVRTRLEIVEETMIARARTAGLRGLGLGAAALFLVAAWVCAAVALGLWLREPLSGPAALAIIAGIHLVAAGALALAGFAADEGENA